MQGSGAVFRVQHLGINEFSLEALEFRCDRRGSDELWPSGLASFPEP